MVIGKDFLQCKQEIITAPCYFKQDMVPCDLCGIRMLCLVKEIILFEVIAEPGGFRDSVVKGSDS